MKKICILGTGFGATRAPYDKEDLEFWSVPGIYNVQEKVGKKFKRIYEVHSPEELSKLNIPAERGPWMIENVTHIHPRLKNSFPNADVIDFKKHVEKYGRYFTSSLSWMIAEAIEYGAEEIGIYGVTMSGHEEYAHQKPACSYLIGWARATGIKVDIDRESELMSAPWVYGMEEVPDAVVSLKDKKTQINYEMSKIENDINDAKANYHRLQGAKEQIEWYENNWFSGSKRND